MRGRGTPPGSGGYANVSSSIPERDGAAEEAATVTSQSTGTKSLPVETTVSRVTGLSTPRPPDRREAEWYRKRTTWPLMGNIPPGTSLLLLCSPISSRLSCLRPLALRLLHPHQPLPSSSQSSGTLGVQLTASIVA